MNRARQIVVCVTIGGAALILPLSAPATADGPMVNWLPDAACNEGTENAPNASPANPHTPHSHPGTDCMTMPGTKGPNN